MTSFFSRFHNGPFDDSPEMKHVSEVIERLKRSARIGDNVRLMDVEPTGKA